VIRVKLQRSGAEPMYVEFDAIPLEEEDDFRCVPHGQSISTAPNKLRSNSMKVIYTGTLRDTTGIGKRGRKAALA
jgi:hypothetical protein